MFPEHLLTARYSAVGVISRSPINWTPPPSPLTGGKLRHREMK